METQTRLADNIDYAGEEARLDNCVKILLANKAILAWILKTCVSEFAPFDIATIETCIEGEPDVANRAVHKDTPDIVLNGDESIIGANTEDTALSEQTVTYDIRFNAVVPDEEQTIQLLINVEAQNNAHPGYPLENRVIYYMSRMISGQYGQFFSHSEYEKLRKVYSIWFCTRPPKQLQNQIRCMKLVYTDDDGRPLDQNAVDFMQGVLVYLSEDSDASQKQILRLMNTLLSDTMNAADKKTILGDEFHIAMTKTMESEVPEMCNYSQGVFEHGVEQGLEKGREEGLKKGLEKGREEGREQGREEGREEGREQGSLLTLIALVKEGLLKLSDAAKKTGKTEEEFKALLEQDSFK